MSTTNTWKERLPYEIINPEQEASDMNRKKRLRKEEVQGIVFANIPFLGFCIFGLIPLLMSLYLCFNSFKGLR